MSTVKARSHADWEVLKELFHRYLQDDAEATRSLFSDLQGILRGYFGVRTGFSENAEDLAQATLLKIHFARDRFDPKQSLKTWVFTIASRSLIDHWRGAQDEVRLDEPLSSAASGELDTLALETLISEALDPARKTELHRDLNEGLMRLKPKDRSIVYLYGVEGLSMSEIATALSLTEGAVKLRAHRAYKELRSFLGAIMLAMPLYWDEIGRNFK